MTALDKAFIKAYQQTGEPPKPAPLGSTSPVPLREALAQLPPEPPKPKGPSRSKVLATLAGSVAQATRSTGKPKGKRGDKAVRAEPRRDADAAIGEEPGSVGLSRAAVKQPASRLPIEALGLGILPLSVVQAEASPAEPTRRDEPVAAEPATALPVAAEAPLAETPIAEPPAAGLPTGSPDAPSEEPVSVETDTFRPMLQVDSFAWPEVCTKLTPAAAAQIDRLALGLIGGEQVRPRVIAIVGSGRGAGCTTLLLGAARRLAARGLRLALVDADSAEPVLASRLGLAPELGWEEVAAGRVPLPEVLIESLEDRLVLLPGSRRPTNAGSGWPASRVGPLVEQLQPHFDLVLVDLGAIGSAGEPRRTPAGWLDAAVVVHDVRGGRIEDLFRTQHRLTAAGVLLLGVAENFAAAEGYRRAA